MNTSDLKKSQPFLARGSSGEQGPTQEQDAFFSLETWSIIVERGLLPSQRKIFISGNETIPTQETALLLSNGCQAPAAEIFVTHAPLGAIEKISEFAAQTETQISLCDLHLVSLCHLPNHKKVKKKPQYH